MSDSERKRAQRTRDKRAAIDAIGDEQNAPLAGLVGDLGACRGVGSSPAVCSNALGQKSAGAMVS
jgi:hypothetical protein